MSIERAFVEIEPEIDPSSFEAAVDGAMGNVEARAEAATAELESSFESAADDASASLDGIDPDFEGVAAGADAAGSDVEAAFDSAAEGADASLGGIDGDGFEAVSAEADAAGSDVEATFDQAADSADAALGGVEGDFSSTVSGAESAGDAVSSSFESAADEAGSALASVEGDFSQVEGAAEGAASSVAAAMEGAADQAGSALGSVQGDFSGAVSGAEGASSSIEAAIAGAAAAAVTALDSVDPSFSSATASAQSAASDVEGAFDGVGDEITEEMDEGADAIGGLQGQVRNLIGAVVGLAVLRQSALDAERFNSAVAATDQILQATGNQVGLLQDQLMDMARELEFELGIDVTDVTEAQNLLLTFRNVSGDIFQETITLAADLSVVLGTDLNGSVLQLGKALNDPVLGMSALSRAGVTFTEQQREQARVLVESGDLLGAQTIILEELRGQVAGTAAATRDSSAVISNEFADLRRQLGTPIIGAVDDNLDAIVSIVESLGPAAESLGALGGATIEIIAALEPAITTVADLIGSIPDPVLAMAGAFIAANSAMRIGTALLSRLSAVRLGGVVGGMGRFAAGLGAATVAMQLFGEGSFGIENGTAAAEQAVDSLADGVDNELVSALSRGNQWLEDSTSVLGLFRVNWFSTDEAARGAANNFEESIGNIDSALSRLVQQGGMDRARDAVHQLALELGIGTDEFGEWVQSTLPEYNDALIAAELQTKATEEAIKEFGAATEEVGDALGQFQTDDTSASFVQLSQALQDSSDQAGDFQAVADALGVDLETLRDTVVPGVTEEFDNFSSGIESAMPGMADIVSGAFERMGEAQEELTFEDVQASVGETLETARGFAEDLESLVDSGLINLAQLGIEGGPEVTAALVSGPEDAKEALELVMDDLNRITRESMLDTAADAAIVSFFVGEALKSGTLEPLQGLPEEMRVIIQDRLAGIIEETDHSEESNRVGDEMGSNLIDGFSPAIAEMLNLTENTLPETIRNSEETAREAGFSYGSVIEGAAMGAADPLEGHMRTLFRNTAPGEIAGGFSIVGSRARQYGGTARRGVTDEIDDVGGIIRRLARGAFPDALSSGTGLMRGAGRGVGGAGGDGVESGLRSKEGEVDSAASGLVNSAEGAASGATGGFSSVGAAMAGGIASGMGSSSAVNGIIGSATSAIRQGLAAARAFAGISSPSRLFANEVGIPISEGMASGIRFGQADVSEAALETMEAAFRSLPDIVRIPAPRVEFEGGAGLTERAARSLLDAARRGDLVEEDFSFRGLPDEFTDQVRQPIQDAFFEANPGFDFTGPGRGFNRMLEDFLPGFIAGLRDQRRGFRATQLAPESVQALAEALARVVPRDILLQAGSEKALARMVANGDRQLSLRDPGWRD